MARNIALAGLGRADRKVNQALALRCWKNNGCTTGTGGKLTVAYHRAVRRERLPPDVEDGVHPPGADVSRRSAGSSTRAHTSDFNKAFADWKAAIAQGVDLIVTYPDFGDAMIPVMKEATDAGIPVATYAWGYVSDPGKNYLTVVGEDTCALGKTYAYVMNAAGQDRRHRLPSAASRATRCRRAGRSARSPRSTRTIKVVAEEPTNWDRRRSSRSSRVSWLCIPTSRAGATSTGSGWRPAALAAYKAAGKLFDAVLTLLMDDVCMGCHVDQSQNPELQMFYYTSGNSQIRVAFTAAMMELKGAKIPPQIVFPIQLQEPARP